MTFIYRDFAYYNKDGNVSGSIGDIRIYIAKNTIIEVYISNLYNDKIQSIIYVKYSPVLELYNIISIILDKLSYDLVYQYYNCNKFHKDFILNENINNISEIWNKNTKFNSCGAPWLPFTRENIKFLDYETEDDEEKTINGEVFENGDFYYRFEARIL